MTWTGGNPGTYVYIDGTVTEMPLRILTEFRCLAPADDHQFTIPPSVLLGLPAGSAAMSVQNIFFTPFSAKNLDVGMAGGDISYSGFSVTLQ